MLLISSQQLAAEFLAVRRRSCEDHMEIMWRFLRGTSQGRTAVAGDARVTRRRALPPGSNIRLSAGFNTRRTMFRKTILPRSGGLIAASRPLITAWTGQSPNMAQASRPGVPLRQPRSGVVGCRSVASYQVGDDPIGLVRRGLQKTGPMTRRSDYRRA